MQIRFMLLRRRLISSFITVLIVCCATLFAEFVEAVGVSPAVLDVNAWPGQVVEQTITIVNTDDETRTFQLETENFTPSETPGVPIFDGGANDELPSWISFPKSLLELAQFASEDVTVKVAVPAGAIPGDYYGAIFVKNLVERGAAARTAVLMFLTVEGNAEYGIELVSARLSRKWSPNALVSIELKTQNSGNVYVKPTGYATVNPILGRLTSWPVNPEELRIMPRQTRTWIVDMNSKDDKNFLRALFKEFKYFAIGPVKVSVRIEVSDLSDEASVWFWAIPWRTSAVLAGFTLLYVSFRLWMNKRINK